jgi:dienelactone hydrolase
MGSELNAAVPFYRGQPSVEDVAKIKAPVSAQYGGLDDRIITSGWPAFDKELTTAKVRMRALCTRVPITASTTTPRRVTTKRPPSRPGIVRSLGSINT